MQAIPKVKLTTNKAIINILGSQSIAQNRQVLSCGGYIYPTIDLPKLVPSESSSILFRNSFLSCHPPKLRLPLVIPPKPHLSLVILRSSENLRGIQYFGIVHCHPPKFKELTGDPVFCISGIQFKYWISGISLLEKSEDDTEGHCHPPKFGELTGDPVFWHCALSSSEVQRTYGGSSILHFWGSIQILDIP